jgi:chorismate dehydratase
VSVSAASPAALRIGCVAYLNARPLIEGLSDDLVLDHPANLVPALRSGSLDAALIPVRAILDDPSASVVDGVGIASEGPVLSVLLAHRGPLAGLRRVALDPASLTSSQLVRVVLERFLDLRPVYGPGPAPEDLGAPAEGEGILKIGDQAIAFRRAHGDALEYLDLGEAWTRATGLPFIYALWCLRPGLAQPEAAAGRLRDAMERGIGRIDDLVADLPDPGFARLYLTRHIRHRIRVREKAGLARFAEELSALQVLPQGTTTAGWRWI